MSSAAHRRATVSPGFAGGILAVALIVLTGCSGTTGGEQGPVDASSNQPVASGRAPALGTSTVAGVSVAVTGLTRNGSGIAVLATVTSDHPDRLLSISSNYTAPATLPSPLEVRPGTPVSVDPATVSLRPNGPIDDGATVALSFGFATAGPVQVYATYKA